ncbi:hypothetical protein VT50_0222960 [Streptomyces antioxidans]|uniref:Uncharacterized protein n=1 Tax=Streptomyces antioxidans TaxID=1507734 RepID=A0A1V4D1E6_9ACTN|nr:hypothetical protein [Streptomyces antioxidans]OPF76709.1 hypothetical protein VT50_0222960 [Streptomyces antioxidans]
MDAHAAHGSAGLIIRDLIVAVGRKGTERILIPGLNLTLEEGETVALSAPRAAASALLLVFGRRLRARYGWIAVQGRVGRTAPVRPTVPRGLCLRPPGMAPPPGTAVCVVDARRRRTPGTDRTGASHDRAAPVGALPRRRVTTLVIVEHGRPESDMPLAERWVDAAGGSLPADAAHCQGTARTPEGGRAGWLSA